MPVHTSNVGTLIKELKEKKPNAKNKQIVAMAINMAKRNKKSKN